VLYALAIVLGLVLNVLFFATELFGGGRSPDVMGNAMLFGAVPAFVMLLFYLPVPAVLDRFDPEPLWCLVMAFFWGAVVATGVSSFVSTSIGGSLVGALGPEAGRDWTTAAAVPVVEELAKGAFIWGFFYFMRREFDGVVDGIVYAIVCALGFAAVENVTYYARAALLGDDVFQATFFFRGIVAPWGHPLYTAMTGIGVGIARESSRMRVRVASSVGLMLLAMALHAAWNVVPMLGGNVFVVSLLFWFAFVGVFAVVVVVLVIRKGRIIREYLKDEVVFGTLTAEEVAFMTSAFGRIRTYFMKKGDVRRKLIRASARLALSKWHVARAMKKQKRTFSIEFIGPLRAEVRRLRGILGQA
jgi:RsiW-degrading membrane proteinase PrsW (M82 family)